MTPQQILIVTVRVLAIVWFLKAIGHLVTAIRITEAMDPGNGNALLFIVPIIELLACLAIWLFPATLSRRLLKVGDAPTNVSTLPLLEWQAMVVIGIGLWTLSYAIPDAAHLTVQLLTFRQQIGLIGDYMSDYWPEVAGSLVKLVIGISLLTGARDLAEVLFRPRTAGLKS